MGARFGRLATLALVVTLAMAVPAATRADGTGSVGASVQVSALVIGFSLSRSEATVGQPVQARATLTNLGKVALRAIVVTLRLDPDGIRIRKDMTRTIARLKGGQSTTEMWTLCGMRPGSYVILARATVGGVSIDSDARLLSIVPSSSGSCS